MPSRADHDHGQRRGRSRLPAGEILLRTLRRLGIVVPTLCHDERLTPYGGCRLCVVARRDGRGGLVPACSTPVQSGMVIETDAPGGDRVAPAGNCSCSC